MAEKLTPLSRPEVEALLGVPFDALPRHIAIIPDGNGRWARAKGMVRIMGHKEGINSVRNVVREARRLGISYLTLYAFSTENWKRPADEVEALWQLLRTYVQVELPELKENGVRLLVIGDIVRIPRDTRLAIRYAMEQTASNTDLVLTIALSYSGRQEILSAVRRFAEDVRDGIMNPDRIDEEMFSSYLQTAGTPDPDLMIRSSGELRISNYLLWQLAYGEIWVTPTLWPDFSVETLHQALRDYANRERRFGQTGDQLAEDK